MAMGEESLVAGGVYFAGGGRIILHVSLSSDTRKARIYAGLRLERPGVKWSKGNV